MHKLDCVYVTSGRHPAMEKVICEATGSQYSHAAVGMEIEGEYRIVEAVKPSIRITNGDLFDGCETKQIITLSITEEQRQSVIERAFELLGKKYGLDDCLIGGIQDVLGETAATLLDNIIDDEETYNCSATQIELIRAAFPDFAKNIDASSVTPERARLLVTELHKKIVL